MLVLTVRDGSTRTLTRRVDGPVCLQPPDSEEPWLAWADDPPQAIVIASPRGAALCRLEPGESAVVAGLTLTVQHTPDGDDATDRIETARHRAPLLALSLPDGRLHSLSARTLVVGSDPGCDVVLSDPAVSARHCEVLPSDGAWLARDLGSTNGLWLSGVRVPAVALTRGVVLTLGRTRVTCTGTGPTDDRDALERHGGVHGGFVGRAEAVHALRATIERYAPAPYAVLIEGESGAGKELVARELHARSPRRDGPLVTVNCGAVAASVIESELFGHEKGAFTGAVARRRGVFEEAHKGTLFLDEIGELPLALQPTLLRALETGEIRRVGGEGVVKVSVRVIAATLRDLEARVREGLFREDLFFRLADFRVTVPPLRARRADIPMLVDHLLARIETETGRERVLEDRALGRLMTHDWPGNVRELLSVLKRAAYLSDGYRIGPEHLQLPVRNPANPGAVSVSMGLPWGANGWPAALPVPIPDTNPASRAVHDARPRRPREAWPESIARDDLAGLLGWCDGNTSRAARLLGIPRSTFRERLARSRLR